MPNPLTLTKVMNSKKEKNLRLKPLQVAPPPLSTEVVPATRGTDAITGGSTTPIPEDGIEEGIASITITAILLLIDDTVFVFIHLLLLIAFTSLLYLSIMSVPRIYYAIYSSLFPYCSIIDLGFWGFG